MNDMVSAPSATRRLKKFGIRKATKKASVDELAPKKYASSISLEKPRTRLVSVDTATIPVDLKIELISPKIISINILTNHLF